MARLYNSSKHRLEESGSATVEFALLLPVLLTILFGLIEYGWYMTWQFVLNNAAAEGARAGVSAREWEGEDPEQIAVQAVVDALWLLDENNKEAFEEFVFVDIDDTSPETITVTVSGFEYEELTGFLPDALIPGYLGAKSVMAFP